MWSNFFAPRFELHGPHKIPPKSKSNNQNGQKNQRIKYHFHSTYPIPLQNGIKTLARGIWTRGAGRAQTRDDGHAPGAWTTRALHGYTCACACICVQTESHEHTQAYIYLTHAYLFFPVTGVPSHSTNPPCLRLRRITELCTYHVPTGNARRYASARPHQA